MNTMTKLLKWVLVRLMIVCSFNKIASKRLVAIAMLVPQFNKDKEYSLDSLTKINETLQLYSRPEALEFSIEIASSLVEDRVKEVIENQLSEGLEPTDKHALAEKVYNYLPDWLRYDKDNLEHDIETLLSISKPV